MVSLEKVFSNAAEVPTFVLSMEISEIDECSRSTAMSQACNRAAKERASERAMIASKRAEARDVHHAARRISDTSTSQNAHDVMLCFLMPQHSKVCRDFFPASSYIFLGERNCDFKRLLPKCS